MALSMSAECVNLSNLSRVEGSGGGGRYECTVLSCAWKAPRDLSGSLASTPLPQCSSNRQRRTNWTRSSYGRLLVTWRCEGLNNGKLNHIEAADFAVSGRKCTPCITLASDKTRRLCCSSSLESSYAISPESLWEDLKPAISYLAPEELKLVHDALKMCSFGHCSWPLKHTMVRRGEVGSLLLYIQLKLRAFLENLN